MRTRSIAAGLLLALYLVLLARRDLDERLPGGWKGPAALLVLALLALVARTAWRAQARRPAWRAALVRHAPLLALAALTLIAAGVRIFGAGFGLPYLDHPDEPAVADRAIAILQTGDFNPHYFVYPNLYTYLEAGVFAVHFLLLVSSGVIERLDQIRATDFYLWGRLLTVVLGTLTVPLVYLAGRRLYGVGAGLIAAGLLALNNLHVQNSQFITVDVPVTFFTALALWLIARLLPRRGEPGPPGWGRYLAAGVAMGLAVGTKYQAGLILLPFLVAHGYAAAGAPPGRRLGVFVGGRLWLALGALGGAFLLTTPFALLDLPHFLNDVASALAHYRYGHLGFEGDYNWRAYVPQLYALDPLPTLLGVAGVVFATLRHRPADLVLVSFPLALYFQMSGYRVIFVHNLLPVLPFTTILAGGLVVSGWRLLARQLAARPPARWTQVAARAALFGVLLLVIWPGASSAAQRDYRFSQPDTRIRAAAWLDSHTPPGTKIWMEMPLQVTPGRYLVTVGDHVTDHPLDWYVANRYEYILFAEPAYKAAMANPGDNLHAAYAADFAALAPRQAAAFLPNDVDTPGPALQLFRTGYTPPTSAADVHPQVPLDVTLREAGADGGALRLLGADLPATAQPGQPLPLVLYWVVEAPLHADYTDFVHVQNAAGDRVAQRDTPPRGGTIPTSGWAAGRIVVDEEDVTLPDKLPPGPYTLQVGMYVQSSGVALTTSGAPPDCAACVLLGPVQVQAGP